MQNTNTNLRIAAVGDIHVHGHVDLRPVFQQVSEQAEVLLLCGDLTDTGSPDEASLLAEQLSGCRIPILAVLGNHDCHQGKEKEIKDILSKAGVIFLDDHVHEVGEVGFVGIKGFGGGFDNHMLGSFGEQHIKDFVGESIAEALKLEHSLMETNGKKIVIAMHYAPIAQTIHGEPPEIFPFLGSSRFAEIIDRFPVSVVFHGHAHHGSYKGATPKGIPVFNCAQRVLQDANKGPYALCEL